MKIGVTVLGWLLASAIVAVAGGGGELQDYDLSAAAARMLGEYERMQHEGFMAIEGAPDPEGVIERTRRWLDRSEALRDDQAAYHYLRARDRVRRLQSTGRHGTCRECRLPGSCARADPHVCG